MLPYISDENSYSIPGPERRAWTENLLCNYCLLIGKHVSSKIAKPEELTSRSATVAPESILAPFRAWEAFPGTRSDQGSKDTLQHIPLPSRRRVWRAYYEVLSVILNLYVGISTGHGNYHSRFQIASVAARNAELRKVETIYEKTLLQEVSFPEANTTNVEIETWTDQIMTNWAILSLPASMDEDLEEGGKSALSRRVLAVSGPTHSPWICYVWSILIRYSDSLSCRYQDLPFNKSITTFVHGALGFS